MENLGSILNRTASRLGFLQKAKTYLVFSKWDAIVGPIAKHARPRRVDGDVLFVATASSVWAQELTFMSRTILEKINRNLGGEYIREIRFSEHLWGTVVPKAKPLEKPHSPLSQDHLLRQASRLCPPELDEQVGEAFKKVFVTVENRKARLFCEGYIACPKCGGMYPERKKECPFCLAARQKAAQDKAVSLLKRYPYLSADSVCKMVGHDDGWIVELAKRELEAHWLAVTRSFSLSGRRSVPPEIVDIARKLAELRAEKHAEDMTDGELARILGKEIAALAARGER